MPKTAGSVPPKRDAGERHGRRHPVLREARRDPHRLGSRGSEDFHIFPCRPRDKRPATANGLKDATTDPDMIRAWWQQQPDNNVAIATGAASGIFVVDVDGLDAEAALRRLEAEHGALPATVEVITARGRHIYFKWPQDRCAIPPARSAPHIDVRGDGGYVLAPPSIHPSGRRYAWSRRQRERIRRRARLAAGQAERLPPPATATPSAEWRALIEGVGEGARDCSVARLAGHLLRHHVDPFVALGLLQAWNATHCTPPLPAADSRADRQLDRRQGTAEARQWLMTTSSGWPQLQDAGELPRRRGRRNRARLMPSGTPSNCRYVAAWGALAAVTTARAGLPTTRCMPSIGRARSAGKWRPSARSRPPWSAAKTVAAVERLARADRRLAATVEQWDAEPFAARHRRRRGHDPAATYDLRTGLARAPDPLDYMTKKTACSAAPAGTPHPLWTAFLDRITAGNAELQGFLQRYIGYCCTGLTTEHVFVFAYGTGANGKSTFINTIARIFGDYATVADMGTFIASNTERHPTDLAKLRGARLVVAQETQKGRRWDETKIKALTGGDKITARFMRQDFFDFVPTFKLFIAGNHKPRLGSVDEAMRRRLLLVPFTVQIPPAERDPSWPRSCRPSGRRSCAGASTAAWNGSGTGWRRPPCVRDATDDYFADQDTIGEWLDDCTEDGGRACLHAASPTCSPPGRRGARNATSSRAARWRCRACWRIAATKGGGRIGPARLRPDRREKT